MATTIRIRKKDGIIRKMLVISVKILSIIPPKYPDNPPKTTPIIPDKIAATIPIFRETRPPYKI